MKLPEEISTCFIECSNHTLKAAYSWNRKIDLTSAKLKQHLQKGTVHRNPKTQRNRSVNNGKPIISTAYRFTF